jgi:hypothetical protein
MDEDMTNQQTPPKREAISSGATDCSSCRQKFEKWISDDPYAKPIERIPDDPDNFAFPGVYRDINTDIAWQAWQVSAKVHEKCGHSS